MERVNALLRHPTFQGRLEALSVLETERPFCRHDLTHLLDVARLMWIAVLEDRLPLEREVVYAAALLHDLGRSDQLLHGVPHEEASVALARQLLPEVGFLPQEVEEICNAIQTHRSSADGQTRSVLGQLLYRADKQCRPCWCCPAQRDCNWPPSKQNPGIVR
jgi:HD superfamily phosphodiesterase